MSNTGPTGPVDYTNIDGNMGYTSGVAGTTGHNIGVLTDAFPSAATATTEAPLIATIDELLASREAILGKEAIDKNTLAVFLSSTALREAIRSALFQWASAGFVASQIIYSFTIEPPSICSDGATRSWNDYVTYCMDGTTLSSVLLTLQSNIEGMQLSQSRNGNTFRIHVTKK
jgi:hypothetical protein